MNLILCCQTIKNKTEIQYSPSNKQLKVKKKTTNFRYERHVFYRNSPTLDQWKSRERTSF